MEESLQSDKASRYLSEEAYKNLEKELEFLIKNKRKEISKRLEESISLGDLSENAEYQEAKESQLMNEQRIAELEDFLRRAIVMRKSNKAKVKIEMGCAVVLQKKSSQETIEYFIVGSREANPVEKKISNESPLGLALMGRKKGETVEVITPRGKISYTIIKIE